MGWSRTSILILVVTLLESVEPRIKSQSIEEVIGETISRETHYGKRLYSEQIHIDVSLG